MQTELRFAGHRGLLIVLPPEEVPLAIRRIGEARDLKAGPETIFPERNVVGCSLRRHDIDYFRQHFHGCLNTHEQSLLESCRDEHDFVIVLSEGHCRFHLMFCHELTHVLFDYRRKSRIFARKMWNAYTAEQRALIISNLMADGYQEYDFIDETLARIIDGTVLPPAKETVSRAAFRVFVFLHEYVRESLRADQGA